MKNIHKLIVSKPIKYNKNADSTLLFLLLFTMGQHEKKKKFEKTLFVSAGAQKR